MLKTILSTLPQAPVHPGTKPDCSKLGKLCTLASHSDDQNGTSEDKGMIVHSVLSVGGVDSLVDKKLIKSW